MTNPEQVAAEGPDWPEWKELYVSDFNRSNPYWMTRIAGRVYELNNRTTHRVLFRYCQPEHTLTDLVQIETKLSVEEIQAMLPDLLMEWLL